MSTLLSLISDTGHDQLWLLLAAQRMGTGLNSYGSLVFESNPPLAIWLSAVVVKLAGLLHLPLTVGFKLCVTLVAAGSAAVCAKLIRRLQPELTGSQRWLLGIAWVVIFGAIPARDFGQRDHILALLVLPYLLAAADWLPNVRHSLGIVSRTLIALTAALGLALKPHQALIVVAVELTILMAHRRWRQRLLEPCIFISSALAYLAAIHILAPTYLTDIVPILRNTYWAFGHLNLFQLAGEGIGLYMLCAVTIGLYLIAHRKSPLILILLAAGVAATFAYTAQGTGWYYQQLPAISFISFALVLQLTPKLGAACLASETWVRVTKYLPIPIAAMTLLAFTLTAHFSDFHLTPRGIEQTQSTPDPSFFTDLPPGAAVATLTTSVDDAVPATVRYHLTLAQRYPHLWMLPAILRNESGPSPSHPIPQHRLAELSRLQHQFMVEDLTRWHPALILIERCQDPAVHCQVLEDRHDDLLAWFLRDPPFADIFAQYHFVRSSGPYDAYRLN